MAGWRVSRLDEMRAGRRDSTNPGNVPISSMVGQFTMLEAMKITGSARHPRRVNPRTAIPAGIQRMLK
jgi:hypothetical protein